MYQYLIENSISIITCISASIATLFFLSVLLNKNLTRWSLDTNIHAHLSKIRKTIITTRKITYVVAIALLGATIAYSNEYAAIGSLFVSSVALLVEVYWFGLRCSLVSKLIKACKEIAKNKKLYNYGIYITQDECWVSAREIAKEYDEIRKYRFCGDYDFSLKQWKITNFYSI